MLYYCEVVDAASAAPSTVSSSGSRSSRGQGDDRQHDQPQASKTAPLVASIDEQAAMAWLV